MWIWVAEKIVAKYSKVGDSEFFDKRQFAWTSNIEKNWMIIRRELEGVLTNAEDLPNFQDISPEQKALTADNHWKTFFLYGYGLKSEKNCSACPSTAMLLEGIPGMTTAFFSVLSPGKHIPEHRGVYNGVLRYHLGLIVPKNKEKCRIRVGSTVKHWSEGDSLIFDDTYMHQVWNDTEHLRVVMFVDFKRPLPLPVALLNDLTIWIIQKTPFVQRAWKNQKSWEAKFYKAKAN
ncbi:aspartyl/asparaginyl beta-hydroxylase domain-containing protein [Marinobacter halodurans]|uniref:Aspartyl/asparaginyl beta-hydroxylase domain-containing protein n=2 Tax=Marinobacter halodurans TaxID=2528979 RepID=A0ABY1ZL33_9GAMM|nr:aspartyl/asparaginyl beta-hydroxylase domain-containing protein [Marinobacter halodurans]